MSTEVAIYEAPAPTEVVRYSSGVADELARVVKQRGLAKTIQGREYLTAEAWGAAGEMMDLSVKVGEPLAFTDSKGGMGYKCRATLYRPDGRELSSAVAICTRSERRWSSADDYAIYSMAQTRAIGKAYRSRLSFIAVLAGYEPTPAEEMPAEGSGPVAAPTIVGRASAAAPASEDSGAAAPGVEAAPSSSPPPPAAAPELTDPPVYPGTAKGGFATPDITITKEQQQEMVALAKRAGQSWASIQAFCKSNALGDFKRQADVTQAAFERIVGFLNEASWMNAMPDEGPGS